MEDGSYEPRTVAAAEWLADLERRTEDGEASMRGVGDFYAARKAYALVRDQSLGLHYVHAVDADGAAICCCGLRMPCDVVDVLDLTGHVNAATGRTTEQVWGYAAHEGEDCQDGSSGLRAYCQRCGWNQLVPDGMDMAVVIRRHRCPTLPAARLSGGQR